MGRCESFLGRALQFTQCPHIDVSYLLACYQSFFGNFNDGANDGLCRSGNCVIRFFEKFSDNGSYFAAGSCDNGFCFAGGGGQLGMFFF